ncbi:SGNH/GDSL hydrolase family protein [Nocardioides marmoriginsengisoli]|uniref:SGNH/GDSL hydrolase family protein n=1 Tax=Nocardioides marmoriginsengisoli TaxID=661483 RepID=A0A3N0CC72_9ACTN|nr:SGNH/GDSL hydrolase family protein [Nocardioides marmoriginsengisoli]RNL61047.1 SGNH/GDSL hydrolase family protein [Nocardioides marmoriginsengisoli]
MQSRRVLIVLSALALLAGSVGTVVPASGAGRHYTEYVALGDSWSADVVILNAQGLPATKYAPIGCAQSQVNYPKLVAKALKVRTFRDATCGSATTKDFYRPQTGLPTGGSNPPQFNRLTRTTDLVTVGIGGNDAGFASAAISCLNLLPTNTSAFDALRLPVSLPLLGSSVPLGGCKQRFVKGGRDQLAEQINASLPKLVAALKEIHRRSPKARILMVNYLDGIPAKGCYPLVPITDLDMAYLHVTFNRLNAMVKRAAALGGAELVDTFADSHGHHVCTGPTTRYVEGLGGISLNAPAIAIPAHPNSAGAASQYRSVMKKLAR